jgi:urocanate hydratase
MRLPELSTIHDRFLSFSRISRDLWGESPGGKLLLRSSLDANGTAVLAATSIAGAASLCVDADAERLREGLRGGFVDFVVANLDEALRILKNELRRARPISVGLAGDPEASIGVMIERGLQPDLLSDILPAAASVFVERGAVIVPEQSASEPGTSLLEWSVPDNPARSMQELAAVAAASLATTRSDTSARRRWLAQSPRYLGRAFAARQCLCMDASEIADFLPRAHAASPAAGITINGEPA